MNLTKQRPYLSNFAVILAIFADLMFPKTTAADSIVPSFTAMAGESIQQEAIVSEETPEIYLKRADDTKPKRVIYVTVTSYSSTPDQTDDSPFVTANGTWVHDGTLAANFLPFGTLSRHHHIPFPSSRCSRYVSTPTRRLAALTRSLE